jgi:hypothetical protein
MLDASPVGQVLAASGPPARNGVLEIVVLVVFAALLVVGQYRRRRLRRRYQLGRRQRAVRLSRQWLEPLVAVVAVAGVLAKDVAAGSAHIVAILAGGVIGAGLGLVRGRFMLGRARRIDGRLVLERNWQELAVIFLLVGLQMVQREVSDRSTSLFGLISSALLALGVLESMARVGYLTVRARSAEVLDTAGPSAAPDVPGSEGAGRSLPG